MVKQDELFGGGMHMVGAVPVTLVETAENMAVLLYEGWPHEIRVPFSDFCRLAVPVPPEPSLLARFFPNQFNRV